MGGGRGERGSVRSVSGETPGYMSQLVPASGATRHAPRATRRRGTAFWVTAPVAHRLPTTVPVPGGADE